VLRDLEGCPNNRKNFREGYSSGTDSLGMGHTGTQGINDLHTAVTDEAQGVCFAFDGAQDILLVLDGAGTPTSYSWLVMLCLAPTAIHQEINEFCRCLKRYASNRLGYASNRLDVPGLRLDDCLPTPLPQSRQGEFVGYSYTTASGRCRTSLASGKQVPSRTVRGIYKMIRIIAETQ
jgi:hypothetical protein